MINRNIIVELLRECWSEESSTKYDTTNPSKGQCSVTSIVINRAFGGQIVKTKVQGSWHYYNKIHGTIYDFTKCQFAHDIEYLNQKSSVKEALTDCSTEQVEALWGRFCNALEIAKKKHPLVYAIINKNRIDILKTDSENQ